MKKFLAWTVGLIMLMGGAAFAAPKYTPAEAAALLAPSVFAFGTTSNQSFCTATKIGPRQYLTALHCARSMDTNYRLESQSGEYVFIRSVLGSVDTKDTNGAGREDWAILIATADGKAPAMSLGCGDPHYVGEPVAYMGFPESLDWAFGVGYISTLRQGERNNADIFIDVPVAPGASGSAVISLDSGHILGVLTEGVMNSRTSEFYMTGVETIESVDECEDWDAVLKHWEQVGDNVNDLSPEADSNARETVSDIGHT